ncbi:uncharacterized protein LOC123544516 [Mercenaria mercenaria]|uniref:uncharacterized protein LOC123544516 n=1 Tax=Mercenaria mercenaria TaxID=6596 RepID=UPI00234ECFB0|nr:uncharacterized protein LOC123544516 [Mercenaria mercenaria]
MFYRYPCRDNTEDTEDQAEHIPDMEEIASQFDNEQYDQFSRQIPVGGRVVKRPGKRLPMSTTRLRYLQRKNKSLSAECSIGGSMLSLNDTTEQDTRSLHRAEFRTYFKPRSDDWLGTIQDERHTFESKFQSHQPRQYKHVESRLLDPKYYLKKTKEVDEQIRNGFEPAHLRSISVDFDNELKNLRKMKSRTSKCLATLSTTNGSTASPPKVVPQNYAERAQKEKLFKETKLYYAVWRSAFTRAIERLRENKKMKAIQLNTPDLLKEEAIRAEKAKKQQGIRARQKPRLSVISPTLQTTQNNTTTQKTRIALNRGSYADMFKKRENIEEKVLDKKEEQTHFVTPRKPRLEPLQKRGIVITKSALNRRTMKIPVQS